MIVKSYNVFLLLNIFTTDSLFELHIINAIKPNGPATVDSLMSSIGDSSIKSLVSVDTR